jgi:hypothetical protein
MRNLALLPAAQGCGKEGGPCCVASRANRFEVTCAAGLTCVPPSAFNYRSTEQHSKLAAEFGAAYKDPAIMGTCKRAPACNAAYGPCGADDCPGQGISCPNNFYCANAADATVGARCIPLPQDAGKAGGPCLPNNLPVRARAAASPERRERGAPCSGRRGKWG